MILQHGWIKETGNCIEIYIKVIPNASKTEIAGVENERIRIRLSAPPEKNKANELLIRLLSEKTGIAKSKIKVMSGQLTRLKRVRITDANMTKNEIAKKLGL